MTAPPAAISCSAHNWQSSLPQFAIFVSTGPTFRTVLRRGIVRTNGWEESLAPLILSPFTEFHTQILMLKCLVVPMPDSNLAIITDDGRAETVLARTQFAIIGEKVRRFRTGLRRSMQIHMAKLGDARESYFFLLRPIGQRI